MARLFARRITASGDVFKNTILDPNRSVNFVTCHDGFTLNDLVSYNHKSNHINGEDNRDGHDHNFSWNCGEEGPSNNPEVEQLRIKQIKNFFTILMISQGTPMFMMGDEIRRSQLGNNNGYCQDNPISWMDWNLVEKNKEMFEFVRQIISFNLSVEFFQEEHYWLASEPISSTDISFHGTFLDQPDFSDHSHSIAFTLNNSNFGKTIHVMVNAYWEALDFELPKMSNANWLKIINTAENYPLDFQVPEDASVIQTQYCKVKERSIVLAMAIDKQA
jgi:glycogen operon protein